jgi:hypothetical protein
MTYASHWTIVDWGHDGGSVGGVLVFVEHLRLVGRRRV